MRRVLLLEDDRDQLEIRKLILEKAGYRVDAAASVEAARAAFEAEAPEVVVMDLRVPRREDGLEFLEWVKGTRPQLRTIVLSGAEEDGQGLPADRFLAKPVRPRVLLDVLAKLAVLLFLVWAGRMDAATHRFRMERAGEVVVDLDLSSPGGDWAVAGKEAALATVRVDGGHEQHVMVWAGEATHRYSIFVGPLAAGAHQLTVERNGKYSAPGAGLKVHHVGFRPERGEDEVLRNAPVLYARANTVGKFTDIPLVVYCERLGDGGLRYTVIFSNEDGGTSTRGLMARWGRTTDIEHVYELHGGTAMIQTREHKDVPFDGQREGRHPLLIPVTDNNMVSGEATSAIRYQLAPVVVDLSAHSREEVMDEHPLLYEVMWKELVREKKLKPEGTIGDPRDYLYVEARIENEKSRMYGMVRLEGETEWRESHLGLIDAAIERSGWVRLAIELAPRTERERIAEIGFGCLRDKKVTAGGRCQVYGVSKAFLLDREARPGTNVVAAQAGKVLEPGERWTFPVKAAAGQ